MEERQLARRGMKKLILLMIVLMIPLQANARSLSSMGLCKITYYCPCEICSGPYQDKTATGTRCEEGRTVAVDPNVIAYGTKLLINGHVYTAEDCGAGVVGDHIDIYLDDHNRTKELGVQWMDVWIIRGGEKNETN